jgi:hypothetical protein
LDTDIFGLYGTYRLPTSSLIVVDEAESIGQAIHIWEQIGVAKIGPAMEDDDRLSVADGAIIQLAILDRDITFTSSRLVRPETSAHHTTPVSCR